MQLSQGLKSGDGKSFLPTRTAFHHKIGVGGKHDSRPPRKDASRFTQLLLFCSVVQESKTVTVEKIYLNIMLINCFTSLMKLAPTDWP